MTTDDPAVLDRAAAAARLRELTPQQRKEAFRALIGDPVRWSSTDTLGADLPPGAKHVRDMDAREREAFRRAHRLPPTPRH